jgi:FAS-associated factor 2
VYQPPVILRLFLTPFSIVSRFFTRSVGLLGYFLPFLPRLFSGLLSGSPGQRHPRQDTTGRRSLNPRDAAARFIREFEEEYGSHSLKLFENGYAQALDIAKRELKFLLVVLLSPEHDDNAGFVRQTLLSSAVVSYINDSRNNIILWAGSVQDSEAYQVSNALHCTKFPFTAVIVQTAQYPATSMSVVTRITGVMPPTAFLAKLQVAVTQHSGNLERARASRAEQEASRSLREEQNSAYERSLAHDRERTRLKKEADAAKARADLQAKQELAAEEKKAQDLLQWKRWRAQSLPEEPSTNVHDVIRVSVRMPSGERVIRRFPPGSGMEVLYAFVECYDVLQNRDDHEYEEAPHPAGFKHDYGFRLVSPMPRTVYEVNAGGTLKDHLGRSGNLIVEPINDDPEDEEDE